MRHFRTMLPMGQATKSARMVAFLRTRFEYALSMLSGAQQGETTLEQTIELDDAAHDIYAALTGSSVITFERVPYSSDLIDVPDDFVEPVSLNNIDLSKYNVTTDDELRKLLDHGVAYRKLLKDLTERVRENNRASVSMGAHFVVSDEDRATFYGEM